MENSKSSIFNTILETFENADILALAHYMIDDIPDYFYDIGASSTGKYHPSYALGDLGLARHTVALCRIMNHIFALEQTQEDFTSRERDLMRLAGIMHDSRKSGETKSRYTVFEHPLLSAEAVRKFKGKIPTVTDEEVELIAKACESHMGQWNENGKSVLPKPRTKYEKLVHLCDYLASRKNIEILFDGIESAKPEPPEEVKIEEYVLPFGKYKGSLICEVAKEHKDYLEWMNSNIQMKEPLKSFVAQLIK